MGKKEKRKELEEKVSYPVEEEFSKFLKKYQKLVPFIDVEAVRELFEQSVLDYRPKEDISFGLYANFYVETRFFTKIREWIEEGNIDLEIALVSQFSSTTRMLLRKLNYDKPNFEQVLELGITNAIENYQGEKGFQQTILLELKKLINPSFHPPKVEKKGEIKEVEIPKPENPSFKKKKKKEVVEVKKEETFFDKKEEIGIPIEEPKLEFSFPKNLKKYPPTTLDTLIASLDIVSLSPLDDSKYVRFLALKYGYYEKQFFDLPEIAKILSIDYETCRAYYLQSLQFVKDWFGLQLDRYYTYLLQKSEKSEKSEKNE